MLASSEMAEDVRNDGSLLMTRPHPSKRPRQSVWVDIGLVFCGGIIRSNLSISIALAGGKTVIVEGTSLTSTFPSRFPAWFKSFELPNGKTEGIAGRCGGDCPPESNDILIRGDAKERCVVTDSNRSSKTMISNK